MISNKWFHQWISLKYFYHKTEKWTFWLALITFILICYGLFEGLLIAPTDYQQGDAFRIMYIHVPSAIASLAIFTFMAILAIINLIWRLKIAQIMMKSSASIGTWMTVLALLSGSIWGKPMWGTFWIWDARLTSELILLFIYLGFIALQAAIIEPRKALHAGSILLIIGFIDIPIIHYSVLWWNTLHQGASLSLLERPKIVLSMLYPLIIMFVAFSCFFLTLLLYRTRNEILRFEYRSQWVKEFISQINRKKG